MKTFINPAEELWGELCLRPSSDNPVVRERVAAIIDRVRSDGDRALRELSMEIDGISTGELLVSEEEIAEATARVPEQLRSAIAEAARNVEKFHAAQLRGSLMVETAPGVKCWQKAVPIQKVGLYIPGGTAPLFSTVLMLAIPAKVAGCPELVLCSPVSKTTGRIADAVLYAASICGVDRIYKAGGAQAIAAMAFGTQTITKVDKIFGPGNQYVTTAKQILGGREVAIDMPAGPSEVMVLADSSSDAAFVAADLLSQAEHGKDSQVMLVCTSEQIAAEVGREVERQTSALGRAEFVEGALSKSRCIVFSEGSNEEIRSRMVSFANAYGPEHLIISTEDPWGLADRVVSAGSVFVGKWSPESAGDYASGTNHTLPTCGWARAYNGVNIDSYIRKITYQELTADGLKGLSSTIITMAEAEGLQAHANAVKVRLAGKNETINEARKEIPSARANIEALEPYSTARDEYNGNIGTFLDANESPYDNGFNRYPDPHQRELKERISGIKGVPAENIFLGNGSDEAIDLMYRIFCSPGKDNAVMISPSYGMYGVCAAINDIEARPVMLDDDYSLPVERILAATDRRTKLIWICSPNNPTGNAFAKEDILRIADGFAGVVVVDEAYADFSGKGSLRREAISRTNLVVLQTLSKAYGMAGLRIGMAFADSRIIRLMSMVKYPYNLDKASMTEAYRLLDKPVQESINEIVEQRGIVAGAIGSLPFVLKVWPSDANFLLVKVTDPDALYEHLLKDGIIVRNRNRVKGCEGCLRITIGTPQENVELMKSLKSYGNR